MATGNKNCVTNNCAACTCSCVGTGGHSCTGCNTCTQNDDHERKQ